MQLCAFEASGRVLPGVLYGAELIDMSSMGDCFLERIIEESPSGKEKLLQGCPRYPYDYQSLRLPIRPAEIWGAGVTYLKSRDAREEETKSKGLYDFVYSSSRPEIFLKGSGQRVVGPGGTISVRSDSDWTVPEPELAVVLSQDCRVLGYTIANDVSARDIEGQNPLYLPQSKIYKNSCSMGPVITTKDEIPNPHSLKIVLRILRQKSTVFEGTVSTASMKRTIGELIGYLKKDNMFFGWTVFMTGTGIVPPDDFSLVGGDIVEIEIEKIGILRNPVSKL